MEYCVLLCVRVIRKKGHVRKWEVEMEWEVFNKSQTIPIGTYFFWFTYTLPFETSGTALCGTTGITQYGNCICHLGQSPCLCPLFE